jgi:hypothetical protein
VQRDGQRRCHSQSVSPEQKSGASDYRRENGSAVDIQISDRQIYRQIDLK